MREDKDSIQASLVLLCTLVGKGTHFSRGDRSFQKETEINSPGGPNISQYTVRGDRFRGDQFFRDRTSVELV